MSFFRAAAHMKTRQQLLPGGAGRSGALRLDVPGVNRMAAGHVKPVAFGAAKDQVARCILRRAQET